MSPKSTMNILQLNDDCLYLIFKQLNIVDLFSVGMSCERFQYIISAFNQKYRVDLEMILSKCNPIYLDDFFLTIGHHIQALKINTAAYKQCKDANNLLNNVERYCHNLENIRLEGFLFIESNNAILLRLLSRLKTCELKDCVLPVPDELFELKNWRKGRSNNRQSIAIENCSNMSPEFIKTIFTTTTSALKHISLIGQPLQQHDFYNILNRNLQQIQCITLDAKSTSSINLTSISQLPHLKHLKLIRYQVDLYDLLTDLAEADRLIEMDLESCRLSNRNYNCLQKFTKLKSLKINKNFWMNDDNLKDLCLRSQLKEFYVFDCLRISDEGIIRFVEMNRYVELLDLSWCYMITNFAISSIIEIMNKQMLRPNLEIIAKGQTKINSSIIQNIIGSAASKLKLTVNLPENPINISLDFKHRPCGCFPTFI